MNLATTTFEKRNLDKLKRVKQEAMKLGMYNPVITEIGPGGLINFLFKYFLSGHKKEWNAYEKFRRGIVKPLETALRHTNLFGLQCCEPKEIDELFKDLDPKVIYVIDCEKKVINAVKDMVEKGELSNNFEYQQMDITSEKIPYKSDIVIAYHVVRQTSNPQVALETIISSVKKGGLLSITRNDKLPGFKMIDTNLYLREAN